MAALVPVRLLGVPWKPTAAVSVKLTLTFTDMEFVDGTTSAYLTVGASGEIWQPVHLLTKALQTARAWIFSAMDAGPGIVGTAADIPLTGTISYSETQAGSRFVWTLSSTDFGGLTLASVTIDNSTGWATPLGLVEDGATATFNAVAGVVTITGAFQPRTLWVFPDTSTDSADRRIKSSEYTNPAGDGDLFFLDSGTYYYRRDFALVDQEVGFAGPSYPIGVFSGFGATRKTLNLKTTDETVLTGGLKAFYQSALVSQHDYVSIGNTLWTSRVKTVGASSLDLYEPFPASASPSAGDEIRVLSEAAALELEMKRTGYLILYSMDDDAGVPLTGAYGVYGPWSRGEAQEAFERRSLADPLYTWRFPLAKRLKTNLTLP